MTIRQLFSFLPVLVLALTAAGGLSSCGDNAFTKATRDHQNQYATIDEDTIQSYLKQNNYTTYTRTDDGVYIVPLVKGTSTTPITVGKQVRVRYTGRVLSVNALYFGRSPAPGQLFDSSFDNHTACGCAVFTLLPLTSSANGVIPGFIEGLTYMHPGDRSLILIPSQQAYGPTPASAAILPDSSLLFDVEVLEVSN